MKKEISSINTEIDFKIIKRILKKYWIVLPIFLLISYIIAWLYLRYTIPTYNVYTTIQKNEENNISAISSIENSSSFHNTSPTKIINLLQSNTFLEYSLNKIPLDIEYYICGKIINSELYPNTNFEILLDTSHNQPYNIPIYIDFHNKNRVTIYSTDENCKFSYDYLISNNSNRFVNKDFSIYLNIKSDFETLTETNYYFILRPPYQRNKKYIDNIVVYPSINVREGIDISLTLNNAKKACDIINTITNDFFNYYQQQQDESYNNVLNYVDEQLTFWENEVYNREENLDKYKKNNNFLDPTDNKISNIQEKIEDYNIELTQLNRSEQKLKNIAQIFKTEENPYKLIASIIGENLQGNVGTCIDKIQQLLLEKENLQYNYTTNSGKIQNINHQINVQINALKEIIQANINAIKDEKTIIQSKIGRISGVLISQEDFSKQMEYNKLKRLTSVSNTYYNKLLETRVSYMILKASSTTPFIILQKATPENSIISPNNKNIYVIFIAFGLLLALLILLYKYITYNFIDDKESIEKYIDIPFLGNIPKYDKEKMPLSQLVIQQEPQSSITESFRHIRGNLDFINNNEGSKIITCTSTVSGEGKTFVITNLAGIFAYSNKKVIVLDMDMRKPKIHFALHEKSINNEKQKVLNRIGMSNLLIGEKQKDGSELHWKDCIHYNNYFDNLHFITAGKIPPNPSELILSERFKQIIAELKREYDYIFLDCPPIGIVADALPCLHIADYPIYVFKEHFSIIPFISSLDNLYTEQQIKNISYVLNASEKKSSNSYNYHYNKYNHYYKDSFNKKENTWKRKFSTTLKKKN